jgi:hypothetical protein
MDLAEPIKVVVFLPGQRYMRDETQEKIGPQPLASDWPAFGATTVILTIVPTAMKRVYKFDGLPGRRSATVCGEMDPDRLFAEALANA